MSTTERDELVDPAGSTRPLSPRPVSHDDGGPEDQAATRARHRDTGATGEAPGDEANAPVQEVADPDERAAASTGRPRRRSLPPLTGRVHRVVKRRMIVRKLDPWSVLKLSLIFYFSVLLIGMLGLTVFWAVVNQVGVIDTLLGFAEEVRLEVSYDAGNIARALFLVGLLNVVLFSGINVFLCFLYNLVADLIGGFRLTLAEEE